MQFRQPGSTLSALATATLLTACGGGGGSSDPAREVQSSSDSAPESTAPDETRTLDIAGAADQAPLAITGTNAELLSGLLLEAINQTTESSGGPRSFSDFLANREGPALPVDLSGFSFAQLKNSALLDSQGLGDGSPLDCPTSGTLALTIADGSESSVSVAFEQCSLDYAPLASFLADGSLALTLDRLGAEADELSQLQDFNLYLTLDDLSFVSNGRGMEADGAINIEQRQVGELRELTVYGDEFTRASAEQWLGLSGFRLESSLDEATGAILLSASGAASINETGGPNGSFTFSTLEPLRASLQGQPEAGAFELRGEGLSRALLTLTGNGNLNIGVYDRDGGELVDTLVTSFEELAAALSALHDET